MAASGFSIFSSGLHAENARADSVSAVTEILFIRLKSLMSGFSYVDCLVLKRGGALSPPLTIIKTTFVFEIL